MKGQTIRALDVLLIGPAMVAGGAVVYGHAYDDGGRRALGAFLIFAGIGTVLYNGNNWLKGEAVRDAAAQAQAKPEPVAAVAVARIIDDTVVTRAVSTPFARSESRMATISGGIGSLSKSRALAPMSTSASS